MPAYKTIVLAFLKEQRPDLHEELRARRMLLQAVGDYATDLRTMHLTWTEELRQVNPGHDPAQLSSEAFELAMENFQEALPSGSAAEEAAPPLLRRGAEQHPSTYATRIRPARGQSLLPMFGQPPRTTHAATVRSSFSDEGLFFDSRPAGAFHPTFPAAAARCNRTNGFHKACFSKGEPSVSPAATSTGRDDRGSVGEEPGPRLSGRSERPRQPGPEIHGDGDHAMDGSSHTEPQSISISSGEKAKARDIIAAILTLQAIEHERRQATPDERQLLSRFGGFGAVALSIFPDPVTGKYKDPAGRPSARNCIRCSPLRNTTAPNARPSTPSTPRPS